MFWMVLIFGILFFVLAKFGFPIITGMVDKRNERINESIGKAKEAEMKLSLLADEQKQMIEEARKEHARILNEAADTRDRIVNEAREKAREETSAMIAKVREEIALEKESAMRSVRREVASLSVEIAEKLVRHDLEDTQKQEELIASLIDEAKRQRDSQMVN